MSAQWPKRADGSPKTMGEMTSVERRQQTQAAVAKTQAYFNRPEVKAAIERSLKETI